MCRFQLGDQKPFGDRDDEPAVAFRITFNCSVDHLEVFAADNVNALNAGLEDESNIIVVFKPDKGEVFAASWLESEVDEGEPSFLLRSDAALANVVMCAESLEIARDYNVHYVIEWLEDQKCTIVHIPEVWSVVVSFQNGLYPDIACLCQRIHVEEYRDFQHFKWFVAGSRLAPHPALRFVRRFDAAFGSFYRDRGVPGVTRLLSCKPAFRAIVTAHAAYFNHLDVLREVCPSKWSHHSEAYVDRVRRIKQLAWSNSFRNICLADTMEPLDMAAIQGHLEAVTLLYRHGYAYSHHALDGAAEMGHLNVVMFLVDEAGMPCTTKTLSRAAKKYRADVVQFLMLHDIQPLPYDFNCGCGNYSDAVTMADPYASGAERCCGCAIQ
ncbi:hypothetical protein DYB36_008270 [Aphanomyces astaci]|uniref:Uncharacterized protein n=1 Tax=Aphanomyces astaci TaxID=112090 RepID=A0A397AAD6_APHAT|nr:hypothetical protein DYB36_008270 [Aphanomyces astaci]